MADLFNELSNLVREEFRRARVQRELRPRIGCGYVLGFLAFFTAAVVTLVFAARAAGEAERVRAMAGFLAAVGGLFVFALVYTALKGLGITWHRRAGRSSAGGIWERDRDRLPYWGIVIAGIVLSCILIGFAAWLWANSDAVAAYLARFPRSSHPVLPRPRRFP